MSDTEKKVEVEIVVDPDVQAALERRKEAMRKANARPRGPDGHFLKATQALKDAVESGKTIAEAKEAAKPYRGPKHDLKPYDIPLHTMTFRDELASYAHHDCLKHFCCDDLDMIRERRCGTLRIVDLCIAGRKPGEGYALLSDTTEVHQLRKFVDKALFKPTASGGNPPLIDDEYRNVLAIRVGKMVLFNSNRTIVSEFLKRREDHENGRNYIQARMENHGALPIPFNEAAKASKEPLAPFVIEVISRAAPERFPRLAPSDFSDWGRGDPITMAVVHFQGAAVYRIKDRVFLFDCDRNDIEFGLFNGFFSEVEPYDSETREAMAAACTDSNSDPCAEKKSLDFNGFGVREAYRRMAPRMNPCEEDVLKTYGKKHAVMRQGELFFYELDNSALPDLLKEYNLVDYRTRARTSWLWSTTPPAKVVTAELDRKNEYVAYSEALSAIERVDSIRLCAMNFVLNAWLNEQIKKNPEWLSELDFGDSYDAKTFKGANPLLDKQCEGGFGNHGNSRLDCYRALLKAHLGEFNDFMGERDLQSKYVEKPYVLPQSARTLENVKCKWFDEGTALDAGVVIIERCERLLRAIGRSHNLSSEVAVLMDRSGVIGTDANPDSYTSDRSRTPLLTIDGIEIRRDLARRGADVAHGLATAPLNPQHVVVGGYDESRATEEIRRGLSSIPTAEPLRMYGKSGVAAITTVLGNIKAERNRFSHVPVSAIEDPKTFLGEHSGRTLWEFVVFDPETEGKKPDSPTCYIEIRADNFVIQYDMGKLRSGSVTEAIIRRIFMIQNVDGEEFKAVKLGGVLYDLGRHAVEEFVPLLNEGNEIRILPPNRLPLAYVKSFDERKDEIVREVCRTRYEMKEEDAREHWEDVRDWWILREVFFGNKNHEDSWLGSFEVKPEDEPHLRHASSCTMTEGVRRTFGQKDDFVSGGLDEKGRSTKNCVQGDKRLTPIALVRGIVQHTGDRIEHVPVCLNRWCLILTNSSNNNYTTRGYVD